MSIICGYAVDMFARGVGYFSGTSFLFVSAVLFLLYKRAGGRLGNPEIGGPKDEAALRAGMAPDERAWPQGRFSGDRN